MITILCIANALSAFGVMFLARAHIELERRLISLEQGIR